MMIKKYIKNNKDVILYTILFLFIVFFLIWKAQYGFGKKDEAFYLLIPYRFYQGDIPLFDETNAGQSFGIFLLPLMKLYMSIFKTTDGILLNYRYIYIVAQCLASLFLYIRLRKINKIAALLSSLYFLLFAPHNIMALSYNTVAYIGLQISFTILITYKNKIELIISGIFFSIATICNPYLAILFIIVCLLIVILKIVKSKIIEEYEILKIKNFSYFLIGIGISLTVFLCYLFSKISLSFLIEYLSDFSVEDPEHPYRSFLTIFSTYFTDIILFNKYTKIIF